MKKKIIFLDIDGVLNSKAYFESIKENEIPAAEKIYNEISEFHVKLLSEIYHACDAKIVLASTWKELDDPSDLKAYCMYQYLVDTLAQYDMILSILVYTFFTRMFDFMLPLVVKYSIVAA